MYYRLSIDSLFPPPENSTIVKKVPACEILPENKFHLVFDEIIDSPNISQFHSVNPPIIEIDEEENGSSESDEETKKN